MTEHPLQTTDIPEFFQQRILILLHRQIRREQKMAYIIGNIIPMMRKRRNKKEAPSYEEIERKLNSLPSSDKQGEYYELIEELIKNYNSNDLVITPEIALELADVVYYEMQLPESALRPDTEVFLFLRFGQRLEEMVYDFCIIKYLTRLQYGDTANYKEIETQMMRWWFEFSGINQ